MPVPSYALLIGPPNVLTTTGVYAMPAPLCRGYINLTNGILESNMIGNTTVGWIVVTTTAQEFQTTAPFIRCTNAVATIRLQALGR